MILVYFLILEIYNPSKLSPFEIFKELENPSESLFMILPKIGKEFKGIFGSLNNLYLGIFEKKYSFNLNSLYLFPSKSRYDEIENKFYFYPDFPETLLEINSYLWRWGKEDFNYFSPYKIFFLKNKYFKIFINDTGKFLIKDNYYFFNSIESEIGVNFIGFGFLSEFTYRKEKDFFLSPYIFGIVETKFFNFYPEIYFDLIKNNFYPMFSIYFFNSFHILEILYEKRSFLNLFPQIHDDFLPFFNFDSLLSIRAFKNEISFKYKGRIFEKFYLNLNYSYGIYENLKFFESEKLWKEKIFEKIKINSFSGILKYEFSKFKFFLNYFYIPEVNFWKNKVVLSFGYDFKIFKVLIGTLYPFKFKEPIYELKFYFYPKKWLYIKFYSIWIKKDIRYYNNYFLTNEIGAGIGVKKD